MGQRFIAGVRVGLPFGALAAALARDDEAVDIYWLDGQDVATAGQRAPSATSARVHDGMACILTMFDALSPKNPTDATLATFDKTFGSGEATSR